MRPVKFLLYAGTAWLSATAAYAAGSNVVWGGPQQISADTDVQTGVVVDAYDFGLADHISSTTVNSVLFSAFAIDNNSGPESVTVGNVTLTGVNNALQGAPAFSSPNPPYANLDPAYQILSANAAYATNEPLGLTIGGLTAGQTYTMVFWVNDSRSPTGGDRIETLDDGNGNKVTLSFNTSATDGGLGQFVTGAFTAAGTSQSITVTGSDCCEEFTASQINGLEVLATPEPSTLLYLAPAIPWLLVRRRPQLQIQSR